MVEEFDFATDELPRKGGQVHFFKITEGEHRFRPVGRPVQGWKEWRKEGETKRPYIISQEDVDARATDDLENINHFIAFLAIDRGNNEVGVLEVVPQSIKDGLRDLGRSPDWGPWYEKGNGYDIVIKRKGSGFSDTKYSVMPGSKNNLTQEEVEMVKSSGISLKEIYDESKYNDKEELDREASLKGGNVKSAGDELEEESIPF